MVSTGLAAAGYEYINMDDCWLLGNRSNAGRGPQVPNPARFPRGLPAVIDHVHSKKLKFGLYTALDNTTCGGFAGSCMHESVDAQQYAVWKVDYVKDDSCGKCRGDSMVDYKAMQDALAATGRPMVLSIEGWEDVRVLSAGGHGQTKRVGHDIGDNPGRPWYSIVSEIDLSSGLWPYAHNASNSASGNGFWNDMDILEVGVANRPTFTPQNDSDLAALAAARAHLSMWCLLKSPILLGNDFAKMSNATLGVLSNQEALEISQDPWGVQARRVSSISPPHPTHRKDNLVNLAPCNASDPLQRWQYRAAARPGKQKMLRVVACNASDSFQQWKKTTQGATFGLENVGLGLALDSSVGGSETWETRAPLGFSAFTGAPAQLWSLAAAGNASRGKLFDSHDKQCLNVVSFVGPDVGLDPCKPAGDVANEMMQMAAVVGGDSAPIQIMNGGKCLAASAGPAGGDIFTVDEDGVEWCLVADGGKGSRSSSMGGQRCTEVHKASTVPSWQPGSIKATKGNRTATTLTFGGGGNALTWGGRSLGASGPLPHHIYLAANPYGAPLWEWPEALSTPAGAALQLPAGINLTDDDHIGGVQQVDSSTMCVALTRGGNLEVWAGALSGHRLAVALFNRGSDAAAMTATWAQLDLPAGTEMAVRDVWRQLNSTATGQVTDPVVPGHGVTLLVLTPL